MKISPNAVEQREPAESRRVPAMTGPKAPQGDIFKVCLGDSRWREALAEGCEQQGLEINVPRRLSAVSLHPPDSVAAVAWASAHGHARSVHHNALPVRRVASARMHGKERPRGGVPRVKRTDVGCRSRSADNPARRPSRAGHKTGQRGGVLVLVSSKLILALRARQPHTHSALRSRARPP